jgi:membrane protease YdiL (CAAX protease family)
MEYTKGNVMKKIDFRQLNESTVLLNLMLTQLIVLVLAGVIFLIQRSNPLHGMFAWSTGVGVWGWAVALAGAILLVDLAVSRFVPEEVTDDGGINRLLFSTRSLWQIALMSFGVAFCEELLFRGAIQHAWGAYWTSVLFAAIHIRYLRHWLMTGLVFCISYGLGWVYIRTGTLWTPVIAHFLVDFVMGCIIRYRRESSC